MRVAAFVAATNAAWHFFFFQALKIQYCFINYVNDEKCVYLSQSMQSKQKQFKYSLKCSFTAFRDTQLIQAPHSQIFCAFPGCLFE